MISCFKGAFRVTSPYGERIINGVREFHKGIDLVGLEDTVVYAVSAGKARTAFQANGAGNYIVITMDDGRRVFYMHLKNFMISSEQYIAKGEPIGVMGNTGNSFGAHTHLELRVPGTSSESLDICAFTGLPNEVGIYYYNPNVPDEEEDDNMTQEKFDAMMDDYLKRRAELLPHEWSKDAREFCESKGIFLGDPDGNKRYRDFITREEVAVIIERILSNNNL